MLQQIQEHPVLFAMAAIGLILLIVLYILSRRIGGNAKKSDRAYITQCSFRPSALSFFPGTITRMSDGMTAPAGTLRMTVGVSLANMMNLPQSVDVKLLVVDENKKVFQAQKQFPVERDDIIGVIDAPFPIKPYDKEFICKAWIVAAYYKDGSTWLNPNANTYEEKNKRFIERKLKKIR